MPVKDHLHIYKRVKGSRNEYMCQDPDCTHKIQKKYMLGKRAACGICGKSFIITRQSLRLAMPHCDECKKGSVEKVNEQREVNLDIGLIDELLGEL